jgi:hypothetical protein
MRPCNPGAQVCCQLGVGYNPLRTSIPLPGSPIRARHAAPPSDLAAYVGDFYEYEVAEDHAFAPVQIYPSGVTVLRFDIRPCQVDAALYGPSLSPDMRGLFFRGVPIFGVAIRPTRAYHLLGLCVAELYDLRIHWTCCGPTRCRPSRSGSYWPPTSTPASPQSLISSARSCGRVLRRPSSCACSTRSSPPTAANRSQVRVTAARIRAACVACSRSTQA